MKSDRRAERWAVAPLFLVRDVVSSAEFYRQSLGFTYDEIYGDPPCFCIVSRGGASIMLQDPSGDVHIRPNPVVDPAGCAWDAYIWVQDCDTVFCEMEDAGVNIVRGLTDQPYGCREFDIDDCNGYRICFGQILP